MNYTDTFSSDVFEANLPNLSQMLEPSHAFINSRAGWTIVGGDLDIIGFVDNVINEIVADGRFALAPLGAVHGQFSTPRTWGARLSVRFGSARKRAGPPALGSVFEEA